MHDALGAVQNSMDDAVKKAYKSFGIGVSHQTKLKIHFTQMNQ